MTHSTKDKYFTVHCQLEATGERFPLKNLYNEMTIKDLKEFAEFATGIPVNLQRLCYLDQGDLLDGTEVRNHDIIPGSTVHLKVWHVWIPLIKAAASNDLETLFELGVTSNSDFCSPNSVYMAAKNPRHKKQWLAERAFVALFIASHRGHQKLCERLLATGADVNAQTPHGRSPLHVAAARDHGKIVDTLLEKGADIDAKDDKGETPLSISAKFGNKTCERHLFLFRWQQRAKQTLKNKIQVDMFAHQYYDSTNPVWFKGDHGQIYYTQILPPGQFQGTALDAPRRSSRPVSAPDANPGTAHEGPSQEFSKSGGMNPLQDKAAMPPISEKSMTTHDRASTACHSRTCPSKSISTTFDEWLRRKKNTEQTKIEHKKAESLHKQQQEEYRQQQVAIKEKSYESWLAEKKSTDTAQFSGSAQRKRRPFVEAKNSDVAMDTKTDTRRQETDATDQIDHKNSLTLWKCLGQENFYPEMKAQAKLLSQSYVIK